MSKSPIHPSTEQVAAVIDRAIKAKGYSVNQTAQLSYVPRQTLERKLAGVKPFTAPELAGLAAAFGIKLSELMELAETEAAEATEAA